jgi:predicted neutral ceramidase superfamily lipid hydrolase
MLKLFKRTNPIYVIIILRSVAVAIQLLLITFVNFGLDYQLPWTPLLTIITLEIVFTILSYGFYRLKQTTEQAANQTAILVQISADIVFFVVITVFQWWRNECLCIVIAHSYRYCCRCFAAIIIGFCLCVSALFLQYIIINITDEHHARQYAGALYWHGY